VSGEARKVVRVRLGAPIGTPRAFRTLASVQAIGLAECRPGDEFCDQDTAAPVLMPSFLIQQRGVLAPTSSSTGTHTIPTSCPDGSTVAAGQPCPDGSQGTLIELCWDGSQRPIGTCPAQPVRGESIDKTVSMRTAIAVGVAAVGGAAILFFVLRRQREAR
jgi:hypothetical protein